MPPLPLHLGETMKTLVEDEFADDMYAQYRNSYMTFMFKISDAMRRAGSFGDRHV